jgi:hypothetical protein
MRIIPIAVAVPLIVASWQAWAGPCDKPIDRLTVAQAHDCAAAYQILLESVGSGPAEPRVRIPGEAQSGAPAKQMSIR